MYQASVAGQVHIFEVSMGGHSPHSDPYARSQLGPQNKIACTQNTSQL